MPSSSPPTTRSPAAEEAEPEPEASEQDTKTAQLKSALWLPLGRLVDRTTLALDKNATPQFIGALTELVWHQIGAAGGDVERFARHAGRKVVEVEDVLLLARRNDELREELQRFVEEDRAGRQAAGQAGGNEDDTGNKAGPGRPKKKAHKA